MPDIEKNKTEKGTLYIVATPIGNIADMSPRAIKTLREVDFIAAEDTRVFAKLLNLLGLENGKPCVSYYEQNKKAAGPQIIKRLKDGESCALITDAGTPAISDPGEDLVRLCAADGVQVSSVPGCCAAITALSLSALPTSRFTFAGFLPVDNKPRCESLDELSQLTHTVVFYEAPHRLKKTLSDLFDIFGERKISLCRELTKLNEQIMRTSLTEVIAYYEINEPRGEYVIVVSGREKDQNPFWSVMSIPEHVAFYTKHENIDKKEAIKAVARDRSLPKNEVYKAILDNNLQETK